ncbi:CapA family protein [Shewanella sp. A32]|uniref:CapA family protein n=1 Tax=Shewanella sp. A32 TaxID=3031327 RepID=UPI0023B9D20A|nr:CapA family protein [Shewanella sp. A32]MDF0533021.1 CapA family protein [Shewanella sp. A32]
MNKLLLIGDICSDGYSTKDLENFKCSDLGVFLSNYSGSIIGNLEAPILEEDISLNKNKFSLKNPPSNSGFFDFCDVLSLANNHIFDQGVQGYSNTVEFLNENSISYLGAGLDLLESRKPIFVDFEGRRIAFLAYNCYSTNSACNADMSSPGSAPLLFDFVSQDISTIKNKKQADFVIVLPHWGIENNFYPTAEQVCFARRVIDAGADAVIGSHTHTIQVNETYKGCPIYFSLGNFLFNNFQVGSQQTYYQSKFNKEGLMVELVIKDNKLIAKEYFLKFNESMLPELVDVEELSTPILNMNLNYREKVHRLKCFSSNPELTLLLKYNGRSAQVVYFSKPVDTDLIVSCETIFAKLKRMVLYRLRKLLA